MFYFHGVKELISVGPYSSARQAALSHLGYAGKYWAEVYGDEKPSEMFDRLFNR
jgi:hypothetical protein